MTVESAAQSVATLIGTMRLIARSDSPLSPGERVGVRAPWQRAQWKRLRHFPRYGFIRSDDTERPLG